MSSKNKYSINELENIANDINTVIVSSTSEDSKLDRSLIFSLRMNMKKLKEAKEIAEEELDEPLEEYQEFEKKRLQLLQEYGGKMEQTPQGYQITNGKEVFGNEEFKETMKDLSDEYSETIEDQNDIFQSNNETRQEKIAEVDWKRIPLSNFPEKISGKEFPLSFIEFVYEDDNGED